MNERKRQRQRAISGRAFGGVAGFAIGGTQSVPVLALLSVLFLAR